MGGGPVCDDKLMYFKQKAAGARVTGGGSGANPPIGTNMLS